MREEYISLELDKLEKGTFDFDFEGSADGTLSYRVKIVYTPLYKVTIYSPKRG